MSGIMIYIISDMNFMKVFMIYMNDNEMSTDRTFEFDTVEPYSAKRTGLRLKSISLSLTIR